MYPDLPVLNRVPEVFEVKLISKRVTILFEATSDFISLLLGQEFRCLGVVTHDEECSNAFDGLTCRYSVGQQIEL